MTEINEYSIRQFMKTCEMDTLRDLITAAEVILEMREEATPSGRKTRKDKGVPRKNGEQASLPGVTA